MTTHRDRDADRIDRMMAPNNGSATEPSNGDAHEYDPVVVEPGLTGFTEGFTPPPTDGTESGHHHETEHHQHTPAR
jgi:hypothetical protein